MNSEQGRGSTRILVVIALMLAALNSALLTEVVLYSRNTPPHHPHWLLGKSLLAAPPMGSDKCLITRNLLAHNQLNLSVWHGFQEVLLDRVGQFERLQFRFRLADDAYLSVFFAKTPALSNGLRLSRKAVLPSVLFQADPGGAFVRQQPLPVALDAGWHQFTLNCRQGQFNLSLDARQLPLQADWLKAEQGVFCLRGGRQEVLVDDLEICEGGQRVTHDNFRNDGHYWGLLGVNLVVLVGLTLVLVRLFFRSGGQVWQRAILIHFVAAGTLCAYLTFDYFFWSTRYHYSDFVPGTRGDPPVHRLEGLRLAACQLFNSLDPAPVPIQSAVARFLSVPVREPDPLAIQLYDETGLHRIEDTREAIQSHLDRHHGPRCTVLFLGTSQTWGEGAAQPSDRLVAQIYRRLTAEGQHQLVVVNAARQGSNSAELLERYRDHLLLFEPKLVVVNLGTNDADAQALGSHLESLARLNEERGIFGLFVIEPNSPEADHVLVERQQVMRAVAARHHIPCLDMHAYFYRPENQATGLVWWDFVHLTSHGQSLAAQYLSQRLNPYLTGR